MEESTASPIDKRAVVGWSDGLGQRHLLAAVSSYGPTPGAESQVAIYSGTNTFDRQVLPAGKASLTTARQDCASKLGSGFLVRQSERRRH